MRAPIITLAAAALLAACASQPPQHSESLSGAATAGPFVVATLSTNECEAITAPTYTAAVVSVRRATDRVNAGQLAPSAAARVLTLGRDARRNLDSACASGKLDANALTAAKADVDAMQNVLAGGAP